MSVQMREKPQTLVIRKIGVQRDRKGVNATVTHRMVGPEGAASCSRISQRLLVFLMKHLGEYLGKTILRPNSGKCLICTLGRIEVKK